MIDKLLRRRGQHCHLLDVLRELRDKVQDHRDGREPQDFCSMFGLCHHVMGAGGDLEIFNGLVATWPRYSGYAAYPVPAPDWWITYPADDGPQRIYNYSQDMYADDDYGNARVDLLEYVIGKLEVMLEDY